MLIKRANAERYHKKDESRYTKRIPTGIPALDKALAGGLSKGLIILAATPGAGKTTLANQMADNIAARGEEVLFVSTEVTAKDLDDKFVSRRTFLRSDRKGGLSVNQLDNKDVIEKMTKKQFAFQAECADAMAEELATFACVDNDPDNGEAVEWTVENIRKLVEVEWINKGKHAPIVFIDYLQFLPSSTPDKQEFDIIKAQVKALKKMSTDFKIPVVLISALTRNSYNDPITLNSFKGNGSIEYTLCKEKGILPILGVEAYVTNDVYSDTSDRRHLILMAKNTDGFRAIGKAVTESNEHVAKVGKLSFPLMDKKIIEKWFSRGSLSSLFLFY